MRSPFAVIMLFAALTSSCGKEGPDRFSVGECLDIGNHEICEVTAVTETSGQLICKNAIRIRSHLDRAVFVEVSTEHCSHLYANDPKF